MKTNIKLRVTPKQSIAVQKICFANGITWKSINTDKIRYTDLEYLFIEPDRIWGRNAYDHNSGPETEGYTEVDADLFIRTNGTCEEPIDVAKDLLDYQSKEDMFKQYGFEVPDFDCTILAKVKNDYIGYVVENDVVIALTWTLKGGSYVGSDYYKIYNLATIKKPWYETCKFPVLLIKLDGLYHETYGLASHCNHPNELCVNNAYEHVRDWRPLSNDEIDQLKQDF